MLHKSLGFLLVLAASSTGVGAVTVAPERPAGCRVVDAGKLPSDVGGGDAVCRAIERAVAARSPSLHYQVEVRVISKSRLSVGLMANGRVLPDRELTVSDRDLSLKIIERFAGSIAEALAASKNE